MKWNKSNINNISDYLRDSQTPLGKIIERATQIHDLQCQLVGELDPEFSDHFWVGGYQTGVLSLLVDSAGLATKLRFSIPEIRDKLRQQAQWSGLKSIEVKIMVTMATMADFAQIPKNLGDPKN